MDHQEQNGNGQHLWHLMDFSTAAMHHRQHGHSPGFFRFLDLPAELRLQIYDFYFTRNKYPDLDLLQFRYFRSHIIPSGLTAVCRQIHAETQEIYKQARAEFVHNTVFSLNVSTGEPPPEREAILDAVRGLPHALHIRQVAFITFKNTVRIEAKMLSDGAVEWKVMIGPSSRHESFKLENKHRMHLRRLQNDLSKDAPKVQSASAGLDVSRCLEAVHKLR
ncbi:hypothetical protein LTR37_011293 [Vermiconidia calcicola]|uniref:Uncharacterized protein n=1 Tax=Vermiconidia calcicola TaxID=1690605 RepID=A0ACC3N2M9_9PEZI|nr:hypothetical protein LTR37_011293 [Vermiconidia calcicola]